MMNGIKKPLVFQRMKGDSMMKTDSRTRLIRVLLLTALCLLLLGSAALAADFDLNHCPKCGSSNFTSSDESVYPGCTKEGKTWATAPTATPRRPMSRRSP